MESSNKKGKSFTVKSDKLESTSENKTQFEIARNKIATNHRSFGPPLQRRQTYGYSLKN